jgi:hypothetical protein
MESAFLDPVQQVGLQGSKTFSYVCVSVCAHVHVCVFVCVYTCVCICMHTHTSVSISFLSFWGTGDWTQGVPLTNTLPGKPRSLSFAFYILFLR